MWLVWLSLVSLLLTYPHGVKSANLNFSVGGVYDTTGPNAPFAQGLYMGLRVWSAYVSSIGGIHVGNDRYFPQFTVYDGGLGGSGAQVDRDAENGVLYNELVRNDHVQFLFGPYLTSASLPAARVAENTSTLLMITGAGGPQVYSVNGGTHYVFGSLPLTSTWPLAPAQFVKSKGAQNVAIVYMIDPSAILQASSFRDYCVQLGMNVVLYENYTSTTGNIGYLTLQALILQIKALPMTVDVLGVGGTTQDITIVSLVVKSVALRIKAAIFLAQTPSDQVSLKNAEYWITSQVFNIKQNFGISGRYMGTTSEFNSFFHSVAGYDCDTAGAFAAAIAICLQIAIERAQSLDTQAIRTQLLALDEEIWFGHMKFSPTGYPIGKSTELYQFRHNDTSGNMELWFAGQQGSAALYPAPFDWVPSECDQYEIDGVDPSQYPAHCYVTNSLDLNAYYGIIAVSILLILLFVMITIASAYKFSTPVFKRASPVFLVFFLCGAIMSCITVIVHGANPSTTSHSTLTQLCNLEPWLFSVSLTCLFGSLLTKVYRLYLIFNNPKLRHVSVSNQQMLKVLASLAALEIVVNAAWLIFGYQSIQSQVSKSASGARSLTLTCTGNNYNMWRGISIIIKVIPIVACAYFSFQTRNIVTAFNESRMNMFATYNILFVSAIITPLVLAQISNSITYLYIIFAVGVFWAVTVSLLAIFVPKLYVAYIHPEQNRKTFGSKNKTTGGSGSSAQSRGDTVCDIRLNASGTLPVAHHTSMEQALHRLQDMLNQDMQQRTNQQDKSLSSPGYRFDVTEFQQHVVALSKLAQRVFRPGGGGDGRSGSVCESSLESSHGVALSGGGSGVAVTTSAGVTRMNAANRRTSVTSGSGSGSVVALAPGYGYGSSQIKHFNKRGSASINPGSAHESDGEMTIEPEPYNKSPLSTLPEPTGESLTSPATAATTNTNTSSPSPGTVPSSPPPSSSSASPDEIQLETHSEPKLSPTRI